MYRCKDCFFGIESGSYNYLVCYYMPPTIRDDNGHNHTYQGNDVRPMVFINAHICGMFKPKPQDNIEPEKQPTTHKGLSFWQCLWNFLRGQNDNHL